MNKKIIMADESRMALVKGAQKLVDAVKITLGPKGRNVVLERGNSTPLITNDGVTIAKEIELKDKFENLGASIIKQVCTKTNDIAGDGTTTACVLAGSILCEGAKHLATGANPILLRDGIAKAVDFATQKLKERSHPITSNEEIRQIATISAGDSSIGELISQAIEKVTKDGIVHLVESNFASTKLEIVEGYKFNRGYLSPYMCTDGIKMEAILDNPYILVTNKKLVNLNEFVPILEEVSRQGASLLIIADDIDGDALATLVVNKVRGNLNVVGVKAPSFADRKIEELEDIATFVGATLIKDNITDTHSLDISYLGRAKSIIVGKDSTTIISGNANQEQLSLRISQLKSQIENATNNYDKEILQERLGKLTNQVAQIKVGAPTEVEMKEKKLRIEDAINATKSALLEGIVAGGGVALFKLEQEVKNFALTLDGDYKLGALTIANSLTAPLKQICLNSGVEPAIVVDKLSSCDDNFGYDALNNTSVDMLKFGIIDPTLVTRSALQNAGSIASTMLTTDCLVVDDMD